MSKRILFLSLALAGCAGTEPVVAPSVVSHQLESGKAPLIIDVRSESEYLKGHIPGAVHVPFMDISSAPAQVIEACKRETVVVTCEHGPRAAYAAPKLRALGCTDVRLLEGHMHRWRNQGYVMTAPGMKD